jgi:putative ABC transport system substrate-binding protein
LTAVQAAASFNIRLEIIEVRGVADFDNAFLEASQHNVEAVIMLSSLVFGTNPQRIASLALQYRLPAITVFSEFAREGGLMAYGANLLDAFRQTGRMVAKVLRGAKPAELPVELPTKFELVNNLKTAKVLGVTVSATLLTRADEVIE